MIRMAAKVFLLAALIGAFALAARVQAQTPPQGMDEATGMDYSCEGTLGYLGCEQLMHPGAPRPAAPPKPDVWGAIALSPSNMAWGVEWSQNTKKAAQDVAMAGCGKRAKDCVLVNTVADVCVALVMSDAQKIYKVGGPTGAINFAEDNAKLLCQRAGGKACKVAVSFCADGVKHELKGKTVFSNGNPIFVPEGSGGAFGRR